MPLGALAALVVGLVLTTLLFVQVFRLEVERNNVEFARQAKLRVRIYNQSLRDSVAVIKSINRLFAVDVNPIGRGQFREITQPLLEACPYILVFAFHRLATLRERRTYETAMKAKYPGFKIKQMQAGKLVTATGAGPFLVPEYAEPPSDDAVLSNDVLSDPVRALGIRSAVDTGQESASWLESYVAANQAGFVFLIRLPLYRRGAPLQDAAARRRAFIGNTAVGFDAHGFAQQVFKRAGLLDMPGIHINVYAAVSPADAALVFRYGAAPPPFERPRPLATRMLGPPLRPVRSRPCISPACRGTSSSRAMPPASQRTPARPSCCWQAYF